MATSPLLLGSMCICKCLTVRLLSLLLFFFWKWASQSQCCKHKESSQYVIIYLEGYLTRMDFKLQWSRVHPALLCICCLARCWAICDLHRYLLNEQMIESPKWEMNHQPFFTKILPWLAVMGISGPSCHPEQPGQPDPGRNWREGVNLISHESQWEPQGWSRKLPAPELSGK